MANNETIIRIVAGEITHLDPPPWWSEIQHLVENKFCVLCYGGKDLASCEWQTLNTEHKDIAIIQYSEAFEYKAQDFYKDYLYEEPKAKRCKLSHLDLVLILH